MAEIETRDIILLGGLGVGAWYFYTHPEAVAAIMEALFPPPEPPEGYEWDPAIRAFVPVTAPQVLPTTVLPGVVKSGATFTSTPTGASVYVDSVYRGKTSLTLENLAVGDHMATFKRSGYEDMVSTFTVYEGKIGSLRVTLKVAVVETEFMFNSWPGGARFYVDNTYKGLTPKTIPITPGTHTIKFTLTGYEDKVVTITAVEGKTGTGFEMLSKIVPVPVPVPPPPEKATAVEAPFLQTRGWGGLAWVDVVGKTVGFDEQVGVWTWVTPKIKGKIVYFTDSLTGTNIGNTTTTDDGYAAIFFTPKTIFPARPSGGASIYARCEGIGSKASLIYWR